MTDARVRLWGRDIGAVSWVADRAIGVFQYAPEFVASGIEVAPLMMPLREAPYEFPALPHDAFKGLPGLLADSLPDKFGNAVIDAWLAGRGRTPESFNPVERLSYIGARGMGALEFEPAILAPTTGAKRLEVAALIGLANQVLSDRQALAGQLGGGLGDAEAIEDIIRVGTSAGGARAKAILAWNPKTGEFRSGQVSVGAGFSPWLMKFDGVAGNKDRELADPQGFGLIEYAYHLMARKAGIVMTECRLHREGGRAHFMTRRFDRTDDGEKLHMQSLAALMHYDFNQPNAYSYEQALLAMRRLRLPTADIEQQFRRAVFNVLARNNDDHVKNIAFLMTREGAWRLSPAFDVAYSFNPEGAWTSRHQMSVNGKRDGTADDDLIALEDFVALAEVGAIKPAKAKRIVDEVGAAVGLWNDVAQSAGVDDKTSASIGKAHRRSPPSA